MLTEVCFCRRRFVLTAHRTLLAALGLWLGASACAAAGRSLAVLPAPAPGPFPASAAAPGPAPSIGFNASSFRNGDTVSVTWSVTPWAHDKQLARTDAVALFLADASNPRLNVPIKYKWAAAAKRLLGVWDRLAHVGSSGSLLPLLSAQLCTSQLVEAT